MEYSQIQFNQSLKKVLLDRAFWEEIPAENILIFQTGLPFL